MRMAGVGAAPGMVGVVLLDRGAARDTPRGMDPGVAPPFQDIEATPAPPTFAPRDALNRPRTSCIHWRIGLARTLSNSTAQALSGSEQWLTAGAYAFASSEFRSVRPRAETVVALQKKMRTDTGRNTCFTTRQSRPVALGQPST